MNKLLFLIACIAMAALVAVGAALAFAPAPHVHAYVSETTQPTCLADGVTTYTCACGDSYTESIPALPHTEETLAGKDATCTEKGLTEGVKCSVCDTIIEEQKDIAALGHDEVVLTAVSPTCTATGLTGGAYCTRCDYTVEQNEIPALGHEMVTDAAVAPNCNDSGLTEGSHCTRCEYKVEQEIIPALGHDVKVIASVSPTCTETGLNQGYYCARCDGYKIKQDVLPAKGHAYDNDDDAICNVCNFERVLPCKHLSTEVFGEAKDATCTEDGITTGIICTVCQEIIDAQDVLPKLGHDLTTYEGKDATCTEGGYKAYEICSRCDHDTYESISALGHDIKIEVAVAPTCVASGLTEGRYCTRCDYKVAQTVVPALGHTVVTDAAVAAKCFATGLTEGSHCSVCKEVLVAQTVTAALGAHTWNGTNCTVCNAYKFEAETFEVINGPADKNMVGDEGKGAAGTNYPSGDAFIYNLQYAMGSSLKVEVKSLIAQKAVVTVNMGRRQYVVNFADIFTVKVNGEVVEANAEFAVESNSSLRYYDWVEVIVATIDLKEGTNVIEFVKNDNDRGLNFDYMSIYGLENGAVLDPREVNGHAYTNWTFTDFPDYENAGSAFVYCDFCRDKQVAALPVVSAENGYTKISSGVRSVWEYNYNGNKILVDVAEKAKTFIYDVTASDDVFTSFKDNNGPDSTSKGQTTDKRNNAYGIFYENTQRATFTMEVTVDEAAEVVFILKLRSTAGNVYKCDEILESISVTNGNNTVAGAIRNDSATFAGWNQENSVAVELATLNLQPGKNVITFTMGAFNVNIAGAGFKTFVDIQREPAKFVYGGNIADFDPFIAENGGSFVKGTGSTAKVTHATNGTYYQNNQGATFTMTVNVEQDTTIILQMTMTSTNGNSYTVDSILTSITSTNTVSGANTVTRCAANSVSFKAWNANTNATSVEFCTIDLKAGENTITFVVGTNNVNISSVSLLSTNEIVFGKFD